MTSYQCETKADCNFGKLQCPDVCKNMIAKAGCTTSNLHTCPSRMRTCMCEFTAMRPTLVLTNGKLSMKGVGPTPVLQMHSPKSKELPSFSISFPGFTSRTIACAHGIHLDLMYIRCNRRCRCICKSRHDGCRLFIAAAQAVSKNRKGEAQLDGALTHSSSTHGRIQWLQDPCWRWTICGCTIVVCVQA